ncbi:hypothetical protein ACVOMS_12820 [Bradyrhizobium guangxiense]
MAMQEEVRACANIRVSASEPFDCVIRRDETAAKFSAAMFPDGFVPSRGAAGS